MVSEIAELRYSQNHLWVRVDEDGRATIGISDHLQEKLGEILGFRLLEEGEEMVKDEVFGIVETADSQLELVAPISGEVTEVNYELFDTPELANEEPYTEGWLMRAEVFSESEFNDLLSLEEYEAYLREELEE